jgi:hypothetical protein
MELSNSTYMWILRLFHSEYGISGGQLKIRSRVGASVSRGDRPEDNPLLIRYFFYVDMDCIVTVYAWNNFMRK